MLQEGVRIPGPRSVRCAHCPLLCVMSGKEQLAPSVAESQSNTSSLEVSFLYASVSYMPGQTGTQCSSLSVQCSM